ncbi:MAG TPA: hypothetical protein VFH29_06085 [Anaerolineales bacterium]|nr:hypothetical protein [Anaerolineales bacterium]
MATAKRSSKTDAERKMVSVRTPNKPGYVSRVDAIKYEAMRRTMMRVLPRKAPGLTQQEMWDALSRIAPKAHFPDRGKVGWWMKSVQLDLEAKNVLVREDTKPLRWHRVK